MAKIIIGIHGLGNKPAAEVLEKWWLAAINEGVGKSPFKLTKIPFKLVYWADILHPEPKNPEITNPEDPHYLDEPYQPANGKVNNGNRWFSAKLMRFIELKLDRIFLKDDMTLNFTGITNRIIRKYFRDLEAYYLGDQVQKQAVREVIIQRLRRVLSEHKNDDILLISHSMGSIISYDVLSKFAHELQVNAFVTIGSPLGLPIIVSRIFEEQKKNNNATQLTAPDCVTENWFNLSDPDDYIALDHTLADDYQPNQYGVRAWDIYVHNDYAINGNRNPHKIYGYLRTPELIEIIQDFMQQKTKHRLRRKINKVVYHITRLLQNVKQFWRKNES